MLGGINLYKPGKIFHEKFNTIINVMIEQRKIKKVPQITNSGGGGGRNTTCGIENTGTF